MRVPILLLAVGVATLASSSIKAQSPDALRFAAAAERNRMEEGDCGKAGGMDVTGSRYEAVMKRLMSDKSGTRMFSDGKNTYVTYALDNRGMIGKLLGPPTYAIAVCAF